jgi:mandelate racemase
LALRVFQIVAGIGLEIAGKTRVVRCGHGLAGVVVIAATALDGLIRSALLALIDLETKEGVTGSSYLFCVTPTALKPTAQLLQNLAEWLADEPLQPYRIERMLHERLRLVGVQGLTGMAVAGIDMAAWDAHSKACGLPLMHLLGGEPRRIPAYNSCGLGLIGVDRVGREASELAAGFRAVKVRLGYPDLATDVAIVRAVREAVGPEVHIMADYNQCLLVAEAVRRSRHLDEEGLYWIEEPTTANDYEGNAIISREARTPIQIGENWWGRATCSSRWRAERPTSACRT